MNNHHPFIPQKAVSDPYFGDRRPTARIRQIGRDVGKTFLIGSLIVDGTVVSGQSVAFFTRAAHDQLKFPPATRTINYQETVSLKGRLSKLPPREPARISEFRERTQDQLRITPFTFCMGTLSSALGINMIRRLIDGSTPNYR